jgi:signal peptidase II
MNITPLKRQLIILTLVVFALVIADQITKFKITEHMVVWTHDQDSTLYQGSRKFLGKIGEDVPHGKFYLAFSLNYVRNHGAAWGTFANFPKPVRKPFFFLITVLATAAIVVYFYMTTNDQFVTRVALSLILAGALGNLFDRIYWGYVVDWIDIRWSILGWRYNFPNFNIADMAITIGMVMLIIDLILIETKSKSSKSPTQGLA